MVHIFLIIYAFPCPSKPFFFFFFFFCKMSFFIASYSKNINQLKVSMTIKKGQKHCKSVIKVVCFHVFWNWCWNCVVVALPRSWVWIFGNKFNAMYSKLIWIKVSVKCINVNVKFKLIFTEGLLHYACSN